jgi:hypothetical protein
MTLDELAAQIADEVREWIAEAEQDAQVYQDDAAYWVSLTSKFAEHLGRAYDIGWHDAANKAMRVCNVRAENGGDWGFTRSNEAAKCALQIESVLVTGTMSLPGESNGGGE